VYDNFFKAIIVLSIFSSGVLGIGVEGHAQSQEIDSLKGLLSNVRGKPRFEVLYELARLNSTRNYDVALSYAAQANEVALSIGDSLAIVESSRAMGQMLLKLNNLEAAIQVAKRKA